MRQTAVKVFVGEATSKKLAQQVAAEKALDQLIQSGVLPPNINIIKADVTNVETADTPSKQPLPHTTSKNPVMYLNELRSDAKYSLVSESGDASSQMFVMSVELGGQTFQGSARNKKLAKAHAAQCALQALYGISFNLPPGNSLIVLSSDGHSLGLLSPV